MTSAKERKEKSEKLLKSLNIPYIAHLPLIEEENEVKLRTPQEIAKRVLVLIYLSYYGEVEEAKSDIIEYLKQENLWSCVSDDEKQLFSKKLTPQDKVNISWRSESIWTLLWAIEKVDNLDLPTSEVTVDDILSKVPDFKSETKDFINNAKLRPVSEILDYSDLIYRIHWATRDAELNNRNNLDLNSSIVYERHYAMNWITFYAEDWDEITTDT